MSLTTTTALPDVPRGRHAQHQLTGRRRDVGAAGAAASHSGGRDLRRREAHQGDAGLERHLLPHRHLADDPRSRHRQGQPLLQVSTMQWRHWLYRVIVLILALGLAGTLNAHLTKVWSLD